MFTGLIEETGSVKNIEKSSDISRLTIMSSHIINDINTGDSIAVNGTCLTVINYTKNSFTVDVMNQTWNTTSLKHLKPGDKVNLERALSANGRFGGHIVTGHIDGTGTICSIKRDGNAIWFGICPPKEILSSVIDKGSIAIDGISLTVAYVTNDRFYVSIIPHTLKETILGYKKTGDIVNLENDIIGKYVKKFISGADNGGITKEFLLKNGF